MKNRTMVLATLALAVTGAALAMASTTAPVGDLWLHVNVHQAAGGRVRVNLPLSVAVKAAALLPEDAVHHAGRVRLGEQDLSAAQLRDLWRAVKDGPDATYVTVDDKDSQVRVAKSGRYLLIRSHDAAPERSRVDVRVPVAVVEALLSGHDDELDVGAAIHALAQQGEGELVTVDGDRNTVRIWVDALAESR